MLQRLNEIPNPKPYRIISLDTEQDAEGNTYIYCVTGEYWNPNTRKIKQIKRSWTHWQGVSDYLFKKSWRHTILTGFNINFDLNTLKHKSGFEWDVVENMGSFIFARPPEDGLKHLKIYELSNFYPGLSLKSACKLIKHKGHIDKHILNIDGDFKQMREACFSHCDAAVACMKSIQSQINHLKSNIEITPALTAQKLFLRNYLPVKCQVFKEDIPDDVKLFMNQAYYGGRTEVFQLGTHNHTTGIDINSSYPRSMRNEVYPDLMTYREKQISTQSQLITAMKDYEGLATVKITSPKNLKIPLLPFIHSNKLTFPLGTWTATYTFPELRKALELKYKITQVYRTGIMKRAKDPMFKSYVDDLYTLKQNPKFKQIAKLMLNSLYGKFGQKANYDSGWCLVHDTTAYENTQLDDQKFRVHNNLLYEYLPKLTIESQGFAPKSYPIIAAYVTSYSRIFLHSTMEKIGFDHVYYCDTDSIYAHSDAVKTSSVDIHPSNLGAWDVEHENITMQIKGLKHYRLYEQNEWEYRSKGVPAKNQSCYWRHNSAIVTRVRKMNTSIRSGKKVNEFFTMLRVNREKDHKRIFISNKNSIPLSMLS